MNVHLTPELRRLVESRVASGLYSSASEVIRAGLRLLAEDEQIRAEIRAKIALGVAQSKAGETVDAEDFFEQLKAEIDREASRS